jgi:hypothetical protein
VPVNASGRHEARLSGRGAAWLVVPLLLLALWLSFSRWLVGHPVWGILLLLAFVACICAIWIGRVRRT